MKALVEFACPFIEFVRAFVSNGKAFLDIEVARSIEWTSHGEAAAIEDVGIDHAWRAAQPMAGESRCHAVGER